VYHIVHPDGGMAFQNVVTSMISAGIKIEAVSSDQWRTRLMQEMKQNLSSELIDEFLVDSFSTKRPILSSKQFYSVISQQNLPIMDHDYAGKWLTFILQNNHPFLTNSK